MDEADPLRVEVETIGADDVIPVWLEQFVKGHEKEDWVIVGYWDGTVYSM